MQVGIWSPLPLRERVRVRGPQGRAVVVYALERAADPSPHPLPQGEGEKNAYESFNSRPK